MADIRAGIDIDALTRDLDAFCAENLPSEVATRLRQLEDEHRDRMLPKYGRFMSQFEATYDVLARVVEHVNYGAERSKWPGHRLVQFVIVVENLKPIYSAYDRLVKGYYEDCMVLMRVAYEAFLRVVFVSLHPDDPLWSFGDPVKGATQFKLTNFVKQELRLSWNEYSVLSSIAHSNKFSVLRQVVEIGREGQKEPLSLGFTYDDTLLGVGMNILRFLLLIYLRTVTAVLLRPRKPGVPDLGLISKAITCTELHQKYFLSHPNEYWRNVAQDLDFVFEVLGRAENGDDWKRFVQAVRGRG